MAGGLSSFVAWLMIIPKRIVVRNILDSAKIFTDLWIFFIGDFRNNLEALGVVYMSQEMIREWLLWLDSIALCLIHGVLYLHLSLMLTPPLFHLAHHASNVQNRPEDCLGLVLAVMDQNKRIFNGLAAQFCDNLHQPWWLPAICTKDDWKGIKKSSDGQSANTQHLENWGVQEDGPEQTSISFGCLVHHWWLEAYAQAVRWCSHSRAILQMLDAWSLCDFSTMLLPGWNNSDCVLQYSWRRSWQPSCQLWGCIQQAWVGVCKGWCKMHCWLFVWEFE